MLDLGGGKVLWHELVAHGRATGDNLASRFSNETGSRQWYPNEQWLKAARYLNGCGR